MPILTPEDHDYFLEHGYLALRQVVPREICARAVTLLESEGDESPTTQEAVAACNTEGLFGAIGELFGPQYDFDATPVFRDMKRPHEPEKEWPTPVAHVDDAYPILMPDGWAIGSFVFLTRVESRGGAFLYFPGSPLRYRQAASEGCDAIKKLAALEEYAGSYREFLAEPGDAILFHHLMGHCGSPNVADSTTRHALLSRWHPRRRIVPGQKQFSEMTTIEKANSTRFLEQRVSPDVDREKSPDPELTANLLHNGFGGDAARIITSATLYLDGRAHLFYVDDEAPDVIRWMSSADLINWRDAGTPAIDANQVTTLHFHQYEGEVILAVGIEGEPPRATLLSSPDLTAWKRVDVLENCQACTPWFIYAKYPSKIAGGQTLYTVSPSTPHRVDCRWAESWKNGDSWTGRSVALEAPPGSCIRDVTVASRCRDSHSAFVVDVESSGEGDGTKPFFTLPFDVAVAKEDLEPLSFSAATTPRLIRLLRRARSYWLVTYVRKQANRDRHFLGEIDWEQSPPTLRELSTPAQYDRARYIVGMA